MSYNWFSYPQSKTHIGNLYRIRQKCMTEWENKRNSICLNLKKRKPTDTCTVQRHLLIKGLQSTDKSISGTCKQQLRLAKFYLEINAFFFFFFLNRSKSWSRKQLSKAKLELLKSVSLKSARVLILMLYFSSFQPFSIFRKNFQEVQKLSCKRSPAGSMFGFSITSCGRFRSHPQPCKSIDYKLKTTALI